MKKKQPNTLIALLKNRNLEINKRVTYSQFQSNINIQKYSTDNTQSMLAGSSPGKFQEPKQPEKYLVSENNDFLLAENNNALITE